MDQTKQITKSDSGSLSSDISILPDLDSLSAKDIASIISTWEREQSNILKECKDEANSCSAILERSRKRAALTYVEQDKTAEELSKAKSEEKARLERQKQKEAKANKTRADEACIRLSTTVTKAALQQATFASNLRPLAVLESIKSRKEGDEGEIDPETGEPLEKDANAAVLMALKARKEATEQEGAALFLYSGLGGGYSKDERLLPTSMRVERRLERSFQDPGLVQQVEEEVGPLKSRLRKREEEKLGSKKVFDPKEELKHISKEHTMQRMEDQRIAREKRMYEAMRAREEQESEKIMKITKKLTERDSSLTMLPASLKTMTIRIQQRSVSAVLGSSLILNHLLQTCIQRKEERKKWQEETKAAAAIQNLWRAYKRGVEAERKMRSSEIVIRAISKLVLRRRYIAKRKAIGVIVDFLRHTSRVSAFGMSIRKYRKCCVVMQRCVRDFQVVTKARSLYAFELLKEYETNYISNELIEKYRDELIALKKQTMKADTRKRAPRGAGTKAAAGKGAKMNVDAINAEISTKVAAFTPLPTAIASKRVSKTALMRVGKELVINRRKEIHDLYEITNGFSSFSAIPVSVDERDPRLSFTDEQRERMAKLKLEKIKKLVEFQHGLTTSDSKSEGEEVPRFVANLTFTVDSPPPHSSESQWEKSPVLSLARHSNGYLILGSLIRMSIKPDEGKMLILRAREIQHKMDSGEKL
ncbi:hypothetical protein ADUPG1_010875 [Aduncisulcus paluster]|uniref:Uncharacterized protein n=1 Tax=Aduncisulcus paluster TaxID=2918883 RepID=A0ABQ5JT76_9EUKA|nr:hypothetical protein ADUPG1_010875 [Aduncisulcus paluster]